MKSKTKERWQSTIASSTGSGGLSGQSNFVALQCAFVLCWVVVNLHLTHQTFEEYLFPLLAGILALEAVLLTSCVLIRQSVIDRTLERRDHLELQINPFSREGSD